jgi:hypothetical protein
MTKIIRNISIILLQTFSVKEIKPCAINSDYKLVIMNSITKECTVYYFFTMKDAVQFASPPNLFMGDGYDYIIYNRTSDNTEKFVKLNDSTKKNIYYGGNINRNCKSWKQNTEAVFP